MHYGTFSGVMSRVAGLMCSAFTSLGRKDVWIHRPWNLHTRLYRPDAQISSPKESMNREQAKILAPSLPAFAAGATSRLDIQAQRNDGVLSGQTPR